MMAGIVMDGSIGVEEEERKTERCRGERKEARGRRQEARSKR